MYPNSEPDSANLVVVSIAMAGETTYGKLSKEYAGKD